jgi:arginyl-tRNA synthetase
MRGRITELIRTALAECQADGTITGTEIPAFAVEKPGQAEHGDFATNIAMLMAKLERKAPRALAEMLAAKLRLRTDLISRVEIAGPGFINFFISREAWQRSLMEIEAAGDRYGRSRVGQGKKVQVEFVSANPTGPLHIGPGAVGTVAMSWYRTG